MDILVQRKIVSPETVMEPLLELLKEAEAVPLVVSGSSMAPFLAHGRDTVYLSKVTQPPGRGDVVLYQRNNGKFVLHRVLRVEGEVYTMLGDAQTVAEPGIHREQIRAVVTAVRRKDRLLQRGGVLWFFFEKVWLSMVPLRPVARRVCRVFRGKKDESQ